MYQGPKCSKVSTGKEKGACASQSKSSERNVDGDAETDQWEK